MENKVLPTSYLLLRKLPKDSTKELLSPEWPLKWALSLERPHRLLWLSKNPRKRSWDPEKSPTSIHTWAHIPRLHNPSFYTSTQNSQISTVVPSLYFQTSLLAPSSMPRARISSHPSLCLILSVLPSLPTSPQPSSFPHTGEHPDLRASQTWWEPGLPTLLGKVVKGPPGKVSGSWKRKGKGATVASIPHLQNGNDTCTPRVVRTSLQSACFHLI